MNTIYKLLAFFPLLFLVAGCANEDELNPSSNDAGIYSLQVQMPGSDNPTRVDLTQIEGTKDLKATWQANDEVLLLLTQGDKEFNSGTVKVSDITEDGKQATINFILPNGINLTKPFTIYGFTGIEATVQYYEDNNWHPRCLASLQRSPIEKFKAPMFTKVEANYGQIPITSFHHFGTYELLHVKNSSNNSVSFAHNGFDVDKAWYQAAAFVEPDDGNGPVSPSGEWDGEDFSDSQTIAAGAEGVFISWYIPSGFPIAEAHLQASVNGKEISSTNTFSSEVSLERGHAYHMYATWNGESLSFDKGSSPNYPIAEAIDLGLPSGTKWASWNIGATKPEESGGYFAWGETEEKDYYGWNNYKWCNGTYYSLTKYCTKSSYGYNGFTDGLTELLPEDDAATVNWGAPWHMPTKAQIDELLDNCSGVWTQLNGVEGILVTGPNGNTIFLPGVDHRWNSFPPRSHTGYYWFSMLGPNYDNNACFLYFHSNDFRWGYNERYYGQPVRAVCP